MQHELQDYRLIVRAELEGRKEAAGRAYSQQRLADACCVQKTYLSRVLKTEAHLSKDQLFLACEFLAFDATERELLLVLLDWQRSNVAPYREQLMRRIASLRAELGKTEGHIDAVVTRPEVQDLTAYYLDPSLQLIHMFLSIELYRKEPNRIAARLGIDTAALQDLLRQLEQLKIIRSIGKHYELLQDRMHLPRDSALYPAYRLLLRHRATERIRSLPSNATYNFSVIFSADEKQRARVQDRFFAFLEETEALVKDAREEEVYQLNFDLFRWS